MIGKTLRLLLAGDLFILVAGISVAGGAAMLGYPTVAITAAKVVAVAVVPVVGMALFAIIAAAVGMVRGDSEWL